MPIEHGENFPQRESIVATVDLFEGWDKESMRDILIGRLKELGIYQQNLLFRGFNGNKIEIVKQHGTDKPGSVSIWCSTEDDLADEYASRQSALDFALRQEKAGLAVYDGEKLTSEGLNDEGIEFIEYEYGAKQGGSFKEALLAVLSLE